MRPELFDAKDWEHFLREFSSLPEQGLVGDPLLKRLEHAWAPLFDGRDEDTCRELYEEVMKVLLREGIAPSDWSALR
ncbi:hypothetical protein [Pseudoxanthomonas indica]|uniref:Uncharacterized protein n=1 Tax=Pseudoxanthomonas indica TaxID=428993 RepID=A0A1T5JE02_9GAMM|nr:hypothetical protein [Pseudoxanthomonas indica]GGD58134.1 hypothetical protein GCM10007235_33070 [Pseudoxanthomonas indica]SKC49670.1 hypothetical protein SAMN06296058_0729 [Pseudoxanthomonas indica]